jgi:hypothetical protein
MANFFSQVRAPYGARKIPKIGGAVQIIKMPIGLTALKDHMMKLFFQK